MNAMTAHPAFAPDSDDRPARCGPRRSFGAAVVAAIYLALLVATPWIVRFAPAPDRSVITVSQVAHEVAAPRCATAPESGRGCEAPARGR
ncbi:MAG: hypothetical protein U1F10_16790 [Burkholderiales bacterium]